MTIAVQGIYQYLYVFSRIKMAYFRKSRILGFDELFMYEYTAFNEVLLQQNEIQNFVIVWELVPSGRNIYILCTKYNTEVLC
jgi:hypothetical protein